ncbi:MAG: hypothetical protein OEY79_03255 [Anaplasmataceae bacterium]|nr:hypothetical protein [Anaplasmataceae bacterium]
MQNIAHITPKVFQKKCINALGKISRLWVINRLKSLIGKSESKGNSAKLIAISECLNDLIAQPSRDKRLDDKEIADIIPRNDELTATYKRSNVGKEKCTITIGIITNSNINKNKRACVGSGQHKTGAPYKDDEFFACRVQTKLTSITALIQEIISSNMLQKLGFITTKIVKIFIHDNELYVVYERIDFLFNARVVPYFDDGGVLRHRIEIRSQKKAAEEDTTEVDKESQEIFDGLKEAAEEDTTEVDKESQKIFDDLDSSSRDTIYINLIKFKYRVLSTGIYPADGELMIDKNGNIIVHDPMLLLCSAGYYDHHYHMTLPYFKRIAKWIEPESFMEHIKGLDEIIAKFAPLTIDRNNFEGLVEHQEKIHKELMHDEGNVEFLGEQEFIRREKCTLKTIKEYQKSKIKYNVGLGASTSLAIAAFIIYGMPSIKNLLKHFNDKGLQRYDCILIFGITLGFILNILLIALCVIHNIEVNKKIEGASVTPLNKPINNVLVDYCQSNAMH